MSTNSDPLNVLTTQRRRKDGSREVIQCPESVKNYNSYMRGVDRADQLRSYYKVRTKCRKMYMYIFWFLFEVAVTNSFILSGQKELKTYKLQLAKELIGSYSGRKRPGRGKNIQHPLQIQHFPIKVPTTSNGKGTHRRNRCHNCALQKKRTDTTFYCNECGIWLCHTGEVHSDCFLKWHHGRVP